jgi:ATP-binding cassette subfamily F protein uup
MSARPPVLALKDVRLADGPRMLFDGADLALEPRAKACQMAANASWRPACASPW